MPVLPSIDAPLPVAQSGRRIVAYDGTREAEANAKLGQTIGGAITGLADQAIEKRDRYNSALAKSSFLKAQIDLENELDQDQDYATYEKRYTERMNKARDQAAGLITSPGERALFQQDLDLNIQRGLGNVMQKAKNKEKDVGRGALLDTIATNRETALRSTDEATRASVIQSTTDAINGAMDRGYLTAQEAVKMRQGATEDYALASVQMLDPSGRLAALSKSGIADLIPTDKRAELKMQAENQIEMEQRRQAAEARQRAVEVRQLQAINRMELSSRVQDAQSAYSQGYEYENPPSKADFYASMDKGQAEKAYSSFLKTQEAAPVMQELRTSPESEWPSILQRFQPAQGGVAGEGFKEDSQIYQHLLSASETFRKQRQADPASYAMNTSPIARQAFEVAQQDGTPEAYQAYVNATVSEQRRLGVMQPKLLPDAMADQLAANFNASITGGENAAALIEQQQAQWGANFPLIAQQLGKKLPQEAQVIATGLPKDLSERMASVANLSDDELKKGLEKGAATNVATAVQSAMGQFARSLQGQSGGIETFNTMYQTANKTALSYVRQGMDPQKAAQKVVNGMVNDKYDFFDTYRVPKTLNTAAVKRGADQALANISVDDLALLPGLRGVPNDVNLEQLRKSVIDGGQWVPNNDESGLSLTLNGYRVLGKDGHPITRSWDELTTEGLVQPESNASRIGRVRGLGVNN
ncbi:hypothetical protein HUS95_28945 [Pseudomonas chlororaphis]|uniref:hypothetical protein n=4 Tax=Pseudomonas chlororaphis TaxID=587753 RepID=UPI001B333DDD|nr:hypothetical protein [Pseudomonas chlororaphis]MBP5059139.1 hypothetical protein [Pseudomonas chlororaphis]